jgi:transposase
MKRRDFTIRERNDLIRMRKAGATHKVIAQTLGRSVSVIQTYCSKHNIRGPGDRRYALTREQRATAIAMWNKGVTKRAIAKHFGCAISTVQNIPGMPVKQTREKIAKEQNIPVTFTASVKRRLDAMSKATGITRTRIIREALRREIERWERDHALGATVRDYGAG